MFTKRKQRLAELRKKKIKARNLKLASAAIAGTFTALAFMNTKVEACSTDYTVQKKDTLYSLSKRYHVTTEQLMMANGLTSGKIYIGQQLMVPDHIEAEQAEGKSRLYSVQKGDTLFSLAKRNSVSMNDLKRLNGLETDKIYIGQKMTIPVEFQEKTLKPVYSVNPGDTLWGIANRFGIKVEELKKANELRLDMVLIGQKLNIPGKVIYTEAKIVGAADNFSVEFEHKGEPFVLTVPYGSAPKYQEISGQELTIAHKNRAVISVF